MLRTGKRTQITSFDPAVESAHELAVVVRVTGREVEVAIAANGSCWTGRDAKFAFEAGVVVNGMRVIRYFCIHQHRSEQNKIAKFWMNYVSVDSHAA